MAFLLIIFLSFLSCNHVSCDAVERKIVKSTATSHRRHKLREKTCKSIKSTLLFDQEKDKNWWDLYRCPLLLRSQGLLHEKCSLSTRGRLSSKIWCSHVPVRRVFDNEKDKLMWRNKNCAKVVGFTEDKSNRIRGRARSIYEEKFKTDEWCNKTKAKYMNSSIPDSLLSMWREKDCISRLSTLSRDYQECHSKEHTPLIAILAATTSRGYDKKDGLESIALFKTLFPSLVCSLDCDYRYLVVIGYDAGDPLFDNSQVLEEVGQWFKEKVSNPLSDRNIEISLRFVRVQNDIKKPGPVFLSIAKEAFGLNADYFYRVNDDSEFLGKWPHMYVQGLSRLTVPYGVIGPSCFQSQNRILTHDFVHRTHMEIFDGMYYPEEFTDWYMDDWISSVYGPERTFISKTVGVDHHNRYRQRIYNVTRDNRKLLGPLIASGRQKIANWLRLEKPTAEINETMQYFTKKIAYADVSNIQFKKLSAS